MTEHDQLAVRDSVGVDGLDTAMDRARKLVFENEAAIRAVADELRKKRRLTGAEIRAVMAK